MQRENQEPQSGQQRVIGLSGWSGSGKTTLVTRLIPVLIARGISVSTLKHAHHAFDVDRPGKDSHRHRAAGAQQVLVSSAKRWALMTENRDAPEPDSAALLARLDPVDLVIIEGFKREHHEKIEVHRPSVGKPALWPDDPGIVAVASDQSLPGCPLPQLPLNDVEAVADFVVRHCGLTLPESGLMAQLSDDCFAFGGPLLPVAEALAMLRERVPVLVEAEQLALASCLRRVLREPVIAELSVPAHDNSAVDGYAVRFADLNRDSDTVLPIAGRAAAGHPLGRPIAPGEAIRIFTGAPMPDGADTVMMQEDCSQAGANVTLHPGIRRGANRRDAGEDIAAGSEVLPAGRRLKPWDLGLAASLGRTSLTVSRPLRVALCSTGDELAEPGDPRGPGQVYDANRNAVAGLLRGEGCQVTDLGILADRAALIGKTLEAAAGAHDLVITTGGVSAGEEDHVKAALNAAGGSLYFWRLAIKPGRPVALGQLGGAAFVGLPGNPVACVVTFAALVRPLIHQMSGASYIPPATFPVVSAFAHRKKRDRQEWLRVTLEHGADGLSTAKRFPREGAGVLSSLAGSDGFLILDETLTEIPAGTTLPFLPFSEVLS